jgi:hypothetical protein
MTATSKKSVLTKSVKPPEIDGRFARSLPHAGEVCHRWANLTQPEGRAGNVYFEGATIYSYGSHFPMARHVERKGNRFVLFTTDSYSSTTAGHKSAARHAIPSRLPVFMVGNVLANTRAEHAANLRGIRVDVAAMLRTANRSRQNKEWRLKEVIGRIKNGNAYAEAVGLKDRIAADLDKLAEDIAAADKAKTAADKRAEKKRAQKLAAEVAEWEQNVSAWKDGGEWPGYCPDSYHPLARVAFLRVKGKILETSQRAAVPLRAVLPILAAVRSGSDLPGFVVEGYTLDGIDREAKTVTIGCHAVTFEEIERVGAKHKL